MSLPRWTVHYNVVSPESGRWTGSGWEFFDEERDAQSCYERNLKAGNCPTKRPFHEPVDGPHLGAAHAHERPRRDRLEAADFHNLPPLTAMCSCVHPYMAHVSLDFVNHSLRCLAKDCACPRFEWARGAAVENLVRALGLKSFRLEYDSDYGIDHRSGWSVVVEGSVVVQFADNPEIALRQAVEEISQWERA